MRMWGSGILNGLRISMRNLRRGPITVQYPKEKIELPERSRWAVAPKYDENGDPKCTACLTCVKTCPDAILDLEFTQDPETKAKHIDHFSYQLGACMMCGLCVESCPYDAILMSHEYELARTDPAELSYDLLTDIDAALIKRAERPAPAAKPAPGATSDAAADTDLVPAPTDTTPNPAEEPSPAKPLPAEEPSAVPTQREASAEPESASQSDASDDEQPGEGSADA